MEKDSQLLFDFAVDRGGTFTDVYCEFYPSNDPSSVCYDIHKLLSEDPKSYPDATREGIRRLLEKHTKKTFPKEKPIETSNIRSIRIGTTVATNALLERKGARTALIITKGFRDLLEIGTQARPNIFDLEIKKPENVYEEIYEVDERVILKRSNSAVKDVDLFKDAVEVESNTNEKLLVLKKPDLGEVETALKQIHEKGIDSVAIVLMHSYMYPAHEQGIKEVCKKIGFGQISASSDLSSRIKIISRGQTACVDAYLNPHLMRYIKEFEKGFDEGIHSTVNLYFMQSDGGLAHVSNFTGMKAILSGPAGGIVGYSLTTYYNKKNSNPQRPVIGFDMGGTSTDVSKYSGEFDHVFNTSIAGVTIAAPQLDINTVAAGGGSRLFFTKGLFKVGPESAGAEPGPVCYRKNGYLAITDANLMLGRLIPKYFPHIFGKDHNESLDAEATRVKLEELTKEINKYYSTENPAGKSEKHLSVHEVAHGFIKVANESMCRPIRALTQARGFDPKNFVLSIFGGAGGQHACAIARELGIKSVFIHKLCGVLSAYGICIADVAKDIEKPAYFEYSEDKVKDLEKDFVELKEKNTKDLKDRGFNDDTIKHTTYLSLRYNGSETSFMISKSPEEEGKSFKELFEAVHKREFGFVQSNRALLIETIRVRSLGHYGGSGKKVRDCSKNTEDSQKSNGEPVDHQEAYFADQHGEVKPYKTPVYRLEDLGAEAKFDGPAIILNKTGTIVVEPHTSVEIDEDSNVWIQILEYDEKSKAGAKDDEIKVNPIELSIFAHRFMSIAEQMGKVLERTAISTNIKERLDFSCALFDPDGNLVANAPHLPVHLGSMQEAVKFQIGYLKSDWHEGEVILSNHPQAGGSHLPDCTVITPVYNSGKVVFYVASRGHHADIGGVSPGSMPPLSNTLGQEGIAILSLKIVRDGAFQEEEVVSVLTNSAGHKDAYGEKIVGTRHLKDNVADFKAQVAANNRGIALVTDLIKEYSLKYVHAYMKFIQANAESSVKEMLYDCSKNHGLKEVDTVHCRDFMDEGAVVDLKLTINRKDKTAIFDFTDSNCEVFGNINTPHSVTRSAIIYSLRCLVNEEIPLNQGCLNPIEIILPKDSLLNPSDKAAVVGGNVLTSQRVTDVVLKAFKACGDSQGCMNNLTFGTDHWGYYETVCGGAGAGPYWHGKSGVHTHMTNTRITDSEVLEKRYPVILRRFEIRDDSGGDGKFVGGNGIVREIEFLEEITVGILSERRVFEPQGIEGGKNAKRGENYLILRDGRKVFFGAKNTTKVQPLTKILVLSPGGGGYGKKE